MPEIGTAGSMGGGGKRSVAEWPAPILDSTISDAPISAIKVRSRHFASIRSDAAFSRFQSEADIQQADYRIFEYAPWRNVPSALIWLAGSYVSGGRMQMDPALLSTISGLLGALIGGSASVTAAVYTQRYQDRLQRVAREATKRETVYADFIVSASKLLLNAYLLDGFKLDSDGQHLLGLANRMRLFAPPNIIDEAEVVIRQLIEISLKPSVDLRKLAMVELSKKRDSDLLLPFSLACRADLDKVYDTFH